MEAYFNTFDIPIESLSKELTVFYDKKDNINHVVQGLIKKGCLGQQYKSNKGTILTDKTLELTIKMIDDFLIYEYRHFKGFFAGDASGGDSIICDTKPGNIDALIFPNGNMSTSIWNNKPSSADLKTSYEERLKTDYITKTYQEIGINNDKKAISSIDLAKYWIVATTGLQKTWDNGETVHGGYPTCSRAIATASMESGGNTTKCNEYDAAFYNVSPPNGGGCSDNKGGCWQTSNPDTSICNDTVNPFCDALQAWGHKTGNPSNTSITSCIAKDGTNANSCTVEQMTQQPKDSHNPGCHFGAMCYGSNATGWNSPLSGALFRKCGQGEDYIGKLSTAGQCGNENWSYCKGGISKAKTSCEIAQCACKIALDDLKKEYPDVVFMDDTSSDEGYKAFITACKKGL